MTHERHEVHACPQCGSTDSIPIAYGYPGPEMMGEAQRSEIILGGCCIIDDQPNHECRACGAKIGRAHPR